MKKDLKIMLGFIGVIAFSGIIIFMSMSNNKQVPQPHDHEQGVFNNEEQSQPVPTGPDTTSIRTTIVELEDRLKAAPKNFDLLAALGNAYYDMGNPSMAIQYYEQALKEKPNSPGVIVDLGAMYRQNGEPDKAIEMFRKAIALDPQLPQAHFNLGMVLRLEKNDAKAAAEAWKRYLELDPNSEAKAFLQEEIAKAEVE